MGDPPRAVLVGNSGVGKTSLVQRIAHNTFSTNISSTIGAGVTALTMTVNGKSFLFNLWDTAGQEIFKNVVPLYFRNAAVAILVFDLDDEDSFRDLDSWLETINENNEHNIPVIVAANKVDSYTNPQLLTEAKQWSFERRYPFFVTSAATGQGVKQMFEVVGSICATQTESRDKPPSPIKEEKNQTTTCC